MMHCPYDSSIYFRDAPKNIKRTPTKSNPPQIPTKPSNDGNRRPNNAAISIFTMIHPKRPFPRYQIPRSPSIAPHPLSDPSSSPIVAATSLLFANNNPQTLHSVNGPAGPILQHGLSAAPHSIHPRRY